jgi:alpha-L-fucosidase
VKPAPGAKARHWFDDARFGVFVHFGLYALHGGNENDYGRGIMPKAEYERLIGRFNPQRFDADAWVRLFKEAGARYAVLTTKHGEGFCLWDTDQTSYKITNSPFRRDLVREYAEACRRGGLRVGFYFSICDWHYQEPGEGTPGGRTFPGYVEAQLCELLTRYGRVDEIWFDGGDPRLTPAFMRRIVRLIHALQPSCVVTDRGLPQGCNATRDGDFITPERFIPANVSPRHRKIECCDAMGRKSWGYHRDETFWSSPELIGRLCRVAALDGNYLLNVEPMPDGRIRPECVARLRDFGGWVRAHGEAVFNAGGCAVVPCDAADATRPALGVTTLRGRTLYVHLLNWPMGDDILLPGITGNVARTALPGFAKPLSASSDGDGLRLAGLPSAPPHGLPTVVRVDFASAPKLAPATGPACRLLAPLPGDTYALAPEAAAIRSRDGVPFHQLKVHPDGTTAIGMVFRHGAELEWRLAVARSGEYAVWAHLGAMPSQADSTYTLQAGRQTLRAKTELTGHYDTPRWFRIGRLRLKAGRQRVTWRLVDFPRGHSADIHGFALTLEP